MADHWIKVEKGTPDKPEILEMSAILSIDDPDTIVGKLIRVWAWFDSNSENGHAPSVTNVLLDRLTGVTGFVDAMVKVGWLQKSEDGFEVSNFDRHLGKGAKKRASDAERKRKSRELSQQSHEGCHKESVTESGLDKIREDKNINTNVLVDGKPTTPPYESIRDLYNQIFPMLPQCKSLDDSRKSKIRGLWRTELKTIEDWSGYFNYVKTNCTWVLSPKPRGGQNSIDWFLVAKNFRNAKEGSYDDRTAN